MKIIKNHNSKTANGSQAHRYVFESHIELRNTEPRQTHTNSSQAYGYIRYMFEG